MKIKTFSIRFFVFLIIVSGKVMSQLGPNGLPIYQDGKLYFQLKLNSSVVIIDKNNIVADPGGIFQFLFTKYEVVHTEIPYAALQTPELEKTYRISFNQPAKVDSFILELADISSDIAFAEKVPAIYSQVVPNELTISTPQAASLYHLSLLKSDQASNIHISPGNAPGNAVVAIVDDAILTSHEDLNANIGSLNADVTSTVSPTDPNPPLAGGDASYFTHGTHVAGIAGGVTNNSVGIASIGWNNKLMCVKTSDGTDPMHPLTDPYAGLTWAATNGAKVINMSWGSVASSSVHYNVVVAAKNNNVVLVAAAGNGLTNQPVYPAAYGEGTTGQAWEVIDRRLVVAVAALDQNNDISVWGIGSGSSYGHWVDIAAYGTDIMSTLAASTASGSAINNQYGLKNGTSMAAPMISGIAGIMRSYNPGKTADEIIDCLINTANPDIYSSNHPSNQFGTLGSGRADAEAALRCISSNCTVNPIVIIVPSSPSLCANTTLTLTANQGASSYLWSTSATTPSIVISTPGTYSVLATYPGNCTATASIIFSPPPTLNIAFSTNTTICEGYSVAVLGATGNYSALVWEPGSMVTNSIVVNPTVVTVYTVTANQMCGGTTVTVGVNPTSYTQPLANAPYSILGPTLAGYYPGSPHVLSYGRYIVSSDATVNISATFYYDEVLIAPNVRITVPGGSTLNLNYSHLRTCGTSMWDGLVVNDGGQMTSDAQTIIEDAVTALSSTHTPAFSTSVPPAVIHLRSTVFNKNHTDVSLTNFYDFTAPSSYSNSLKIDHCVFTCRDFGTVWVAAGHPPKFPNGSFQGLRFETIQNPGLGTPYGLFGFTVTTLKAPYTGQTSHCAIFLNSSAPANNIAGNDFVIGDITYASGFNLFDYHNVFVNAQNCNVTLKNNVFQNQLHSAVPPQNVTINYGPGFTGGGWSNNSAAVMHRSFDPALSTTLDMSATSTTLSNRFFNCVRGVEAFNTEVFKMSYGFARSTHTADGANIVGASGLNLNTNRVNYDIHHNEFSNIKNAINIPLTAGFIAGYVGGPSGSIPVYGNSLSALAIYNNQFNAGNTSIGNFMNQAIYITNDLNVWPNSPSPLPALTPLLPSYGWLIDPISFPNNFHPTGLGIIANEINGAWNGINVNGFNSFPVWIAQNTVTLVENSGTTQYGIQLSNGTSTAPRQQSVWLNDVKGAGNTGADLSLVYCALNSGNTSPIVNCNNLKDATKGFVFAGTNIGSQNLLGLQWRGNVMENLKYGMRLDGYVTAQSATLQGVIGQQGDNTVAMGNYWSGSTWTGTNYSIWTQNSQATLSPLYHMSTGAPLNLWGNPSLDSYGWGGQGIITATNNNFACDWTQYFTEPDPETLNPDFTDLQAYLSNAQKYHFLRYNEAERDLSSELQDWYDDMEVNSNLEALELTQESLYRGDYDEARTLIANITAENYVEETCMAFYGLYANYVQGIHEGTAYGEDDSLALAQIAALCPIEYGASVNKARALYNSIYSTIVNYEDCNGTSEGRPASQTGLPNEPEKWDGRLFPNPTGNMLIIQSTKFSDDLVISILDLAGRQVLLKKQKSENYLTAIEIDLVNGAYLVRITNSDGLSFTKKLLVAR